jgi:uncharacterized membrane protein
MATRYLKLFLITLVVFLAVDMIWLGFVARDFYQKHLGPFLAPEPDWIAAGVFYLLFIAGILFFAVAPGLKEDSLRRTLQRAAMYGLVTYATYDLTNLATLKDWPAVVAVVDMAWGTVLCVTVSLAAFAAGRRLR